MPQAARPLPQARPSRPSLRVVPSPRRPPPEVIRRRRAVALGGLAALIGLPLLLVFALGGTPSASGQISEILARGAAEPATLCDHLSTGMLRAVGGHDACVAASPTRAPGGTVHDVRIDGARATAVVSTGDREESVRLVREDGGWKVDEVS